MHSMSKKYFLFCLIWGSNNFLILDIPSIWRLSSSHSVQQNHCSFLKINYALLESTFLVPGSFVLIVVSVQITMKVGLNLRSLSIIPHLSAFLFFSLLLYFPSPSLCCIHVHLLLNKHTCIYFFPFSNFSCRPWRRYLGQEQDSLPILRNVYSPRVCFWPSSFLFP